MSKMPFKIEGLDSAPLLKNRESVIKNKFFEAAFFQFFCDKVFAQDVDNNNEDGAMTLVPVGNVPNDKICASEALDAGLRVTNGSLSRKKL